MGFRDESGEVFIGTQEGVCKVRTVRRKGSAEERWNWDQFGSMKGVPWEPEPGRPGVQVRANIVFPRVANDIA